MTIELPPDLEERINRKIDDGEFETPLDVVRDALDQQPDGDVTWMTVGQLRREVVHALEQSERGESSPGEEVFRRLRARLDAATAK
jgi:Arc/MetJ-type ribon-helix-helix transcriptional regulator